MKIVSYDNAAGSRGIGVLRGESVLDIGDLVAAAPLADDRRRLFEERGIPVASGGTQRWLQIGADARRAVAQAAQERSSGSALALADLVLRAPVARPGKIVGVGRNYADHAKETGVQPFEQPRIIFKMPSSISDPGAAVSKPAGVEKMDFEAELAVVIGEFARDVSRENAPGVVAGYTALNDLSAREFQFDVSPAQTTFAKSMDGFCPLGPWLVTADEIGDPQALRVQCRVNGEPMQDASTADMLFPVAELIAYISRFMTLEPGDVIATGTPAGIGAFRNPPRWLGPGDRVTVEVEKIGTLDCTIRAGSRDE